MPDTDAQPETTIDPRREAEWDDACNDPAMLRHLVHRVSMSGNLGALIALACEESLTGDPPPDEINHRGAMLAIHAYADWMRAEEGGSPIEVLGSADATFLTELGRKYIGWSPDGSGRIIASADTPEEVRRLAAEAGEPEAWIDRHTKHYRQL